MMMWNWAIVKFVVLHWPSYMNYEEIEAGLMHALLSMFLASLTMFSAKSSETGTQFIQVPFLVRGAQ